MAKKEEMLFSTDCSESMHQTSTQCTNKSRMQIANQGISTREKKLRIGPLRFFFRVLPLGLLVCGVFWLKDGVFLCFSSFLDGFRTAKASTVTTARPRGVLVPPSWAELLVLVPLGT
jgi:hypothetical protein